MENETFCFIDDIRQKKVAATGAHHKVVKNGCKLPFEYKTRKELKNLMNSPIISTNPMPYKAFKSLPHDEQQHQLDLWGEHFGKSLVILGHLLDVPKPTIATYLRTNKLDFKGVAGNPAKQQDAIKKAKFVSDMFYGRIGTPSHVEEPEINEPGEELTPEIIPEHIDNTNEPETPPEPLAKASRFCMNASGIFTSDELEILLRSLRNASQVNPDGRYQFSVTLTEV